MKVTEVLEVGICGTSPGMSAIEASLGQQPRVRLRRLGNSLSDSAPEIKMLSPHAVLFAMKACEELPITLLLQEQPEIALIGVDEDNDTVTVFSLNTHSVSEIEELVRLILEQTEDICGMFFCVIRWRKTRSTNNEVKTVGGNREVLADS
ncbi:MAG TPA: hypothetical protein VN631_12580 [Negativicutes bacterium]|nr:hypothetical protein [Negativicutes bacterium]